MLQLQAVQEIRRALRMRRPAEYRPLLVVQLMRPWPQAVAASRSVKSAGSWAVLVLTRRRSPDATQETWLVYYGNVRVGTIALRSGNPADTDPWGWSCGFYPGSGMGFSPWLSPASWRYLAAMSDVRARFAEDWWKRRASL
jgi:hypothetical protein